MSDEELVTGVVVGAASEPIAGYVKLGARGARRAIGGALTLRTDDGHEIELVNVTTATIDPETKRKAAWQELEGEPGANLCVAEAPAPDVEAELCSALVRGGDTIAAWGKVREHTFDGDGSGGAYREGATRRVRVLAPSLVVLGERCVERLEKLREAPAFVPLRPPQAEKSAKVSKPKSVKKVAGPWTERGRLPPGVFVALPLVLIFVGLAIASELARPICVAVIGGGLGLPLVLDAMLVPNYRGIPDPALRSASTPGTAYVLLFGTVALFAVMMMKKQADLTSVLALIAAAPMLGVGAWLARATAKRRRLTRLIATAPMLAGPVVDGTWQAIDGTATVKGKAPRMDGNACIAAHGTHVHGWGSKNSKGQWTAYDTKPIVESVSEIAIEHAESTTIVSLYGALWLSTTSYERRVDDGKDLYTADVIREGAQVRVVGRAKDGVVAKGGEESLLILATDVIGEPAASAAALAWRDRFAIRLAFLGAVLVAASVPFAIWTLAHLPSSEIVERY